MGHTVAAISLGLAAAAGCALPDFELRSGSGDATTEAASRVDAGTHDAGHPKTPDAAHGDARGHDTGATTTGCVSKQYPPPPGGPDVPGTNTFTLAVRTIDLGEQEANPAGYDLDHVCTCIDDGGPSCVPPGTDCDFPGGVDNGAVALIQQIDLVQPAGFGSGPFSTGAENGAWSLLFQLTGYGTMGDGGVADDPDVVLTTYASPGSITPPPLAWNGSDKWKVSASSVGDAGLATPLYRSMGAYVSNHVLVAALPDVELTIAGSTTDTITIDLTGGFITGTLEVLGDQIQIRDGVLTGRWGSQDIFDSLSSYRDNNGKPLCTTDIIYRTGKASFCGSFDILVNASDPASVGCDALSMGVGFTAFPIAPLMTVAPPATPTPGCDAGIDPKYDSCDGGS